MSTGTKMSWDIKKTSNLHKMDPEAIVRNGVKRVL